MLGQFTPSFLLRCFFNPPKKIKSSVLIELSKTGKPQGNLRETLGKLSGNQKYSESPNPRFQEFPESPNP